MWIFLLADEHFENRSVNNSFDGMNKNENEVLLECSEDVPFSPLRQSYTPLPMNQFNGNETDEIITADEIPSSRHNSNYAGNELHIIDIKLNEQGMLDDANDDDDDDEQPTNDDVNMSISKENVVLFTINAANNDGKCIFSKKKTFA